MIEVGAHLSNMAKISYRGWCSTVMTVTPRLATSCLVQGEVSSQVTGRVNHHI
jgi:hypothetical protein